MAEIEACEQTNLTNHKDQNLGKGKEKIDDDGEITFKGMVAKVIRTIWIRRFAKDLREAIKEEEAYLKAKKEREANGEAEPVHLPFWCQSW
ncbi:hypothetical protein CASFOL_027995 [Castilleja foliolosa]|uniref:Uncharacterized protein n=1 Tax=Castilleja foliolosa TaxID=1961234 RepID=A0ABD3CHE6_9LAMI